MGLGGEFDSTLDVILFSVASGIKEILSEQVCKNVHPLVSSHHDLLISKLFLPTVTTPPTEVIPLAPKIQNTRTKIQWSQAGIAEYEAVIGPCLDNLAARWCDTNSSVSMAVLLSSTYSTLQIAAKSTNEFVDLSKTRNSKPKIKPHLLKLRKSVLKIHKEQILCPWSQTQQTY